MDTKSVSPTIQASVTPVSSGIRKRNQIQQANRVMFIWIAAVSVVVGISIVLIGFLAQKILFGEKVINEKNKTVSILEKNLSVVGGLRDNIRVLNTNEVLKSVRLSDTVLPIQSVLDALPAESNSTSLASSLQTKLLAGIPGVVLETINVVSAEGSGEVNSSTVLNNTGDNKIGFTFSVSTNSANYNAQIKVLERLEKSIRPFNITDLSIESQGNKVVMTATGFSYFEPAKTVKLMDKVVKP
ncbi:MAG: hypothetical protein WAW80_00885 [Candidatus Saccharimonadales bacterium]